MWQFPAVFLALFATDFVYARYNIASTTGRAVAASHYAALIILLGGFGIVSYTQDHLLLIPAALGAWAGTFCAVHFKGASNDHSANQASPVSARTRSLCHGLSALRDRYPQLFGRSS